MSITDELREWASVEVPYKYGHQLNDIADRIDAAVDGMVELHKDADGVPIRVGDRLTNKHHKGTFTVVAIGGGINMHVVYFKNDDGSLAFHYANECHHCKPDTWEKIIEDAIVSGKISSGYLEVRYTAAFRSLVARCKELAGDAE